MLLLLPSCGRSTVQQLVLVCRSAATCAARFPGRCSLLLFAEPAVRVSLPPQTASKRVVNAKATAYASRVHKRGSEPVEKVSFFLGDGRWPGVGLLLRLRSGRCMHQHWATSPAPGAAAKAVQRRLACSTGGDGPRPRIHAESAHPVCLPCPWLQKKASKLPVGPVMLGFFLFVVVGSGEDARFCCCWPCCWPTRPPALPCCPSSQPIVIMKAAVVCSLCTCFVGLTSLPPCPALPTVLSSCTALLQIIRTATTGQAAM